MVSKDHNSSEAEETKHTISINRRRFLQTVGASGGVMGIGILNTDPASASQVSSSSPNNLSSKEKDQLKKVSKPYATPGDAENAIRVYGKQLLEELKQRGVITSTSRSALNLERYVSAKERANGVNGMRTISYVFNGVPTAHIYTTKETPDHHLTIVAEPQLGRSYAILKDSVDNPESANIIDPSSKVSTNNSTDGDIAACDPSHAGTYCLHDGSDDDPTPEDNCWLDSEVYNWYCTAFRTGCCYLGDFQKCAGLNATCYTGVDCTVCQ